MTLLNLERGICKTLARCGKTPLACHSGEPQAVLSEAKEESRTALENTQSGIPRCALENTSFPRKRESIGLTMGPRFRGGDDYDFHPFGWPQAHDHSD